MKQILYVGERSAPECCLCCDCIDQIGRSDKAVAGQVPQVVKIPGFVPRGIEKGDDFFSCDFVKGIDADRCIRWKIAVFSISLEDRQVWLQERRPFPGS